MISMFFKQQIKKSPAIGLNIAKNYLKISAIGAAGGAAVGGVASAVITPVLVLDSIHHSNAKTFPGRFAESVEGVGTVWADNISVGFFLGGAPITYPLSKLYEKAQQENSSIWAKP